MGEIILPRRALVGRAKVRGQWLDVVVDIEAARTALWKGVRLQAAYQTVPTPGYPPGRGGGFRAGEVVGLPEPEADALVAIGAAEELG